MKRNVILNLRSKQTYEDQEESSVSELVTEGTMEFRDGGWDISYEESELTGLEGVTTTFRVEPGKLTLNRTGALKSQMVFQKGVSHDSLYQMPFGVMLMSVCAKYLYFDIVPDGGFIDLVYTITIENSAAGEVDYHLDIRAK